MRSEHEAESRLESATGRRLSYRMVGEPERVCVGHVPFRGERSFHDCLRAPDPGTRTCERCAIVEATFASNLHHAHTRGSAEIDPSIAAHLRQPNRLYLAAFRDGSIKVGTSTLSRADRRLEEQGAWRARFVAETDDGRIVRRMEDDVTEALGLAQSVSIQRKRRGLVSPIPDDELEARLAEAAADTLSAVVDVHVGERVVALDPALDSPPWRHPTADHPALGSVIDYPLALTSGRHGFTIETAVGRLLVVRRDGGDDHFVIDPAPLYGHWLDIGDYGSDEIAIQDSLF